MPSFSSVVSGRGCSSRTTSPTGTSSSSKRPASAAAAQRCCDWNANASWSSREIAPALGDVLAGLAHRLRREPLRELRIREPPAERRVVERAVAARIRRLRLRRDERRAAHRLDAARDEEVAVPGDDGVARRRDGGESGGAEPVHGHARDRVRQAGEQRRHPGDVAVVLAGLVRRAEVDVFDLRRVDARRARPPRGSRAPRDRPGARPRARRRSAADRRADYLAEDDDARERQRERTDVSRSARRRAVRHSTNSTRTGTSYAPDASARASSSRTASRPSSP